jgi:hypothetical protein
MRTTLDIDDDVLAAANEVASGQKTTAGKVISDLVRKALLGPAVQEEPKYRNGFCLMPKAGVVITPGTVEHLLEDNI